MGFKVKTEFEVTNQMVDDLLCTAFEGGSNYWCDKVTAVDWPEGAEWASDVLTRGGELIIYHEGLEESNTIGPDDIQPALQKMADDYPKHFTDLINDYADADTADVFLQCITLGEIVYG